MNTSMTTAGPFEVWEEVPVMTGSTDLLQIVQPVTTVYYEGKALPQGTTVEATSDHTGALKVSAVLPDGVHIGPYAVLQTHTWDKVTLHTPNVLKVPMVTYPAYPKQTLTWEGSLPAVTKKLDLAPFLPEPHARIDEAKSLIEECTCSAGGDHLVGEEDFDGDVTESEMKGYHDTLAAYDEFVPEVLA